jgi:RNA-directed DNA polymerase
MKDFDLLKSASTLSDLARLLGIKPATLAYTLYKIPNENKYKSFEIPKKAGGVRMICAPQNQLKLVQRKLADLLQNCFEEIETTSNANHISHGFRRGRSIFTNSWPHKNRRFVFNVDLKDFFPSINFGRVRGYFIKDNKFSLQSPVATVIAQIACHDNSLPQGSPCSPVISNLISNILDRRLVRLASRNGCTYTRYADDLTFSTNKKEFPNSIASRLELEKNTWAPGRHLLSEIIKSGFVVNEAKTSMQYNDSRQTVTGLVVNKRVNTKFEYRHTVRAMVHRYINTGEFDVIRSVQSTDKTKLQIDKGTPRQLHGMLGFIDYINQKQQEESGSERPQSGSEPRRKSFWKDSYRNFLLYSSFYAAETPVVLCEGETDTVYLVHAIRSLASEFPLLATVSSDGKIQIRIRIFKYRKSSTTRILGFGDGGSSILGTFIGKYEKDTAPFHGPGKTSPVIVLFDNDEGAEPICKNIKNTYKKTVDKNAPSTHITQNLYVTCTPLLNGATKSTIEDFFDGQTKAIMVDGKAFHLEKDFDPDQHYGKKVFAHAVIRKNAATIDFGGFRPLLRNIEMTIRMHAKNAESAPIG